MGTPLAPRRREAGTQPVVVAGRRVARVLPDLPLDKVFDYLIPDHLAPEVRIGTMVRVSLNGRRIGGWVVGLAEAPGTDRPVQPLAKLPAGAPRPTW